MTTYRLSIVFGGIDFDDDDVFVALGALPDVAWRAQDGLSYAVVDVEAPSAYLAAADIAAQVCAVVPSARPLRLDPDLVNVSDIADRVGVSREAVRNWVNGTRRVGEFPAPLGVVGGSIKVWAWRHVNEWVARNLALGDGRSYPADDEVAEIDRKFSRLCATADRSGRPVWTVTYTDRDELLVPPPDTRASAKRPSWIRAQGGSAQVEVRRERLCA